MDCKCLCSWLGLADSVWPPDPYCLLGIRPGETDLARVEQQVHERLGLLRRYQLSHPEEATEGMNRLAQAFLQVSDSLSRGRSAAVTVAVAMLPNGIPKSNPVPAPEPVVSALDTSVSHVTEVDWRDAPPAVRVATEAAPETTTPQTPAASDAAEAPSSDPTAPPEAPLDTTLSSSSVAIVDAARELAQRSPEARRALGTLAQLLERIQRTRHLALAWKYVGKYLRNAKRRLSKPAEEKDLDHRLTYLLEAMEDFPAFVGQPGLPGYRVVGMARLEMTAVMFKAMDPSQRDELAKDWAVGEKVLCEHRRFLLSRLKKIKRRGVLSRIALAVRMFVSDHALALILAAVAAGGLVAFLLLRR